MPTLDLKVPPVVVALLIGLAMWAVSRATPGIELLVLVRRSAGILLIAIGLGISLGGVLTFRRARTTINPTRPGSASALVCSGIYGFSRNPMYLGVLLILVGWAVLLSNPLAAIGPIAFVLYMNRFQIAPEEKALSSLFGAEFAAYKARVRRWL